MELKTYLAVMGIIFTIVLLGGIYFIVSTLNHKMEVTSIQNNKTADQTYQNLTQLKIRVDKTLDQAEANYAKQSLHEENAKISRQNTAQLTDEMKTVLATHQQILQLVKNMSGQINHFLAHQHNTAVPTDVKPLVVTNKTVDDKNKPIIIINASRK